MKIICVEEEMLEEAQSNPVWYEAERERQRERSSGYMFGRNKQENDRSRKVNVLRGFPTYFIACRPFLKLRHSLRLQSQQNLPQYPLLHSRPLISQTLSKKAKLRKTQ
jgi:hypothetical protein